MMLNVADLQFAYCRRPVLNGLSFSVCEGSLVSVIGPNGAGKSTLFKCILGLLKDWRGEIRISGKSIRSISLKQMARSVAYIPQVHYPAFNYSVLDMVLMGTTSRVSAVSVPGAQHRDSAMKALDLMGISDYADRDYTRISGGEQQLVLIARAIAQDSRLLIMDEPTASLDFGNQVRVMRRVRALADQGYAIVQATHNPNQAFMYSDSILAIKDGRMLAHGSPKDVFTAPLLAALYGVRTQVESLHGDRVRICVPGEIQKQGDSAK